MNRLQEKILKLDFKKTAKAFAIIAVIVVIVGGIFSCLSLRPQMSEMASLWENHEAFGSYEQENGGAEKRGDMEDGEAQEFLNGEKSDRLQPDKHALSTKRNYEREDAELFRKISEPSTAAYITVCTTVLLYAIIFTVYWLLVAAWMYKAAITANMNRALWPILGLLLNWVAVLLFFIFRAQKEIKQV